MCVSECGCVGGLVCLKVYVSEEETVEVSENNVCESAI